MHVDVSGKKNSVKFTYFAPRGALSAGFFVTTRSSVGSMIFGRTI